jgi:hypothetical protein
MANGRSEKNGPGFIHSGCRWNAEDTEARHDVLLRLLGGILGPLYRL